MSELTQSFLKIFLRYVPETGEWFWLKTVNPRACEGDAAGTISVHGYRIITLFGVKHRSARLAWLYMTGEWPENEIDHDNWCKLDDRWDNLFDCTHSENQMNRGMQSNNTSGAVGVHWKTEKGKWCVQVKREGVLHFGGYFDSLEEAVIARDALAKELHGDLAVLNDKEAKL